MVRRSIAHDELILQGNIEHISNIAHDMKNIAHGVES